MLERDGGDFSQRWGYLSRAGMNDKSQVGGGAGGALGLPFAGGHERQVPGECRVGERGSYWGKVGGPPAPGERNIDPLGRRGPRTKSAQHWLLPSHHPISLSSSSPHRSCAGRLRNTPTSTRAASPTSCGTRRTCTSGEWACQIRWGGQPSLYISLMICRPIPLRPAAIRSRLAMLCSIPRPPSKLLLHSRRAPHTDVLLPVVLVLQEPISEHGA